MFGDHLLDQRVRVCLPPVAHNLSNGPSASSASPKSTLEPVGSPAIPFPLLRRRSSRKRLRKLEAMHGRSSRRRVLVPAAQYGDHASVDLTVRSSLLRGSRSFATIPHQSISIKLRQVRRQQPLRQSGHVSLAEFANPLRVVRRAAVEGSTDRMVMACHQVAQQIVERRSSRRASVTHEAKHTGHRSPGGLPTLCRSRSCTPRAFWRFPARPP